MPTGWPTDTVADSAPKEHHDVADESQAKQLIATYRKLIKIAEIQKQPRKKKKYERLLLQLLRMDNAVRMDEGLAPLHKRPTPQHHAITIKDALVHMLATEHVDHDTVVAHASIGHGSMTAHLAKPLAADDDD